MPKKTGSTGYTKGQEKAQKTASDKGVKSMTAIQQRNKALKEILGK